MKTGYWLPEYKAFLEKLIQARKSSGLTQVQVANLINKPQSFVSKCEKGERRVDVLELKLFAKHYQKTIDYFLD